MIKYLTAPKFNVKSCVQRKFIFKFFDIVAKNNFLELFTQYEFPIRKRKKTK